MEATKPLTSLHNPNLQPHKVPPTRMSNRASKAPIPRDATTGSEAARHRTHPNMTTLLLKSLLKVELTTLNLLRQKTRLKKREREKMQIISCCPMANLQNSLLSLSKSGWLRATMLTTLISKPKSLVKAKSLPSLPIRTTVSKAEAEATSLGNSKIVKTQVNSNDRSSPKCLTQTKKISSVSNPARTLRRRKRNQKNVLIQTPKTSMQDKKSNSTKMRLILTQIVKLPMIRGHWMAASNEVAEVATTNNVTSLIETSSDPKLLSQNRPQIKKLTKMRLHSWKEV